MKEIDRRTVYQSRKIFLINGTSSEEEITL